MDRIGLIFYLGGGEHLIHFDLEIFTTATKYGWVRYVKVRMCKYRYVWFGAKIITSEVRWDEERNIEMLVY